MTNFAGTPSDSFSIDFSWTAPQDASGNAAASYLIEYATGACPANAASFVPTTTITGLPNPSAPGTTDSFSQTGFATDATYCFVLISADGADGGGNSAMSNLAEVTLRDAAGQLGDIRAAIRAATGTPTSLPSMPANGVVVSYVKPAVGGAADGTADGPGFYLQMPFTAGGETAIFVAIDPVNVGTFIQPGEVINVVATQGAWLSCSSCSADRGLYAITQGTFTDVGPNAGAPAPLDISLDTRFTALIDPTAFGPDGWDLESLLVSVSGTIDGGFASASNGCSKATLETAGTLDGGGPGASQLGLRIPNLLLQQLGVFSGCDVSVSGVPLYRYNYGPELSPYVAGELAINSCPAVQVVSTVPGDGGTDIDPATGITVVFNAPMSNPGLTAQTSIGNCTGAVQLSSDGFTKCTSFVNSPMALSVDGFTATQSLAPALSYGEDYELKVTAGTPAVYGGTLASDYVASFHTAQPPASCDGIPSGALVISQVYGGGGNSNATYTNDFVELHNRGNTTVSLSGLSIQYAGSTSGTWTPLALNGSIPAGGYYLIQLASGGAVGSALPTADATSSSINMGGTSGKVALVSGTTALSGTCPTGSTIIDLVGYGSANCSETAAAPALSNTTAALRASAGCVDTGNNSSDFAATTPAPRNSSTAVDICSCADVTTVNETGLAVEADYCALLLATNGTSTTTTPFAVQFELFEQGATGATGNDANVVAQVGYGPLTANPENQAGWTWVSATKQGTCLACSNPNNNGYTGTFTVPTTGTYFYGARVSVDNGSTWTYCDNNGAGSNTGLQFDMTQLPTLAVQ